MKTLIKNYFLNKTCNALTIKKFLQKNKFIVIQLQSLLLQTPEYLTIENIVQSIVKQVKLPRCKACNKLMNFRQLKRKAIFCSKKCSNSDKELIAKRLQSAISTNLQIYGTEFPIQSQQILNKRSKTNIERYGSPGPMSDKDVQAKSIQTNLEKYGVKYIGQAVSVKSKRKLIMLNKYGVTHNFQIESVKQQIKQTNIEKYGTEFPTQSNIIKEKTKATNIQKYGCECVFQSEQIKNKIKQTNIQKYGVENPSSNKIIRQKIEQTNLEKYGYITPSKNENVIKTIKQNNLIKYGVQIPTQLPEIQQKIKQTNLKRYGVQCIFNLPSVREKTNNERLDKLYIEIQQRFKEYVIPLFSRQQFTGIGYYNTIYKWQCIKCGNIFQDSCCSHIPRCYNCFPLLNGFSKKEIQLIQFCKCYFPNLNQRDRSLINPYQVDISIPDLKLAIQFNGIFFHSIQNKPQYYHLMKTELCQAKNFRLIHIWEDQWDNNQQQIKEKLIQIFNNTEQINYNSILDRSWFPLKHINGYRIEILQPQIIDRDKFKVENCGYIRYIKL